MRNTVPKTFLKPLRLIHNSLRSKGREGGSLCGSPATGSSSLEKQGEGRRARHSHFADEKPRVERERPATGIIQMVERHRGHPPSAGAPVQGHQLLWVGPRCTARRGARGAGAEP